MGDMAETGDPADAQNSAGAAGDLPEDARKRLYGQMDWKAGRELTPQELAVWKTAKGSRALRQQLLSVWLKNNKDVKATYTSFFKVEKVSLSAARPPPPFSFFRHLQQNRPRCIILDCLHQGVHRGAPHWLDTHDTADDGESIWPENRRRHGRREAGVRGLRT